MSAVSTAEGARLLGFDTEHFGTRIGIADHPDVDEWAAEEAIGCVFLLADSSRIADVQRLLADGWLLTDIRVELAREPERLSRSVIIREATENDIERLVEIARCSHRITRFYADPHFPDDRCDDLYEAWMRNSCAGWAEHILVCRDEPLGYCTVHLENEVASIGLIAVDKRERGKGLGRLLCRAAITSAHRDGAEVITTVTQARNVAALRLFESCGFRVVKTGYWLHKWFDR